MTARLLLLFAAAAAGLSQSETDPYFALSSARTFPSNGKPVVALSSWNIDALEFRVYRVRDAVQFFQQLEDPHQFGGRVPRPPQRRTLLERVHRWKRTLRADIRRGVRAQFTESPSAHLPASKPAPAAPPPKAEKGTKYSEIPVLNSEQMVLNFVQPVRARTRWDQQTVAIDVQDKGVYLVEAVRGDLRAYTLVMVSDAVLITKNARGRVVNMVVDRNTGQPIAGVRVVMVARDRHLGEAETDAQGVAELKTPAERLDEVRLVAKRGADVAVSTVGGYSFGPEGDDWRGYLYTDRPIYRPGHTVHFKGILRVVGPSGYTVPAGRTVAVTVNDPDQKPVYQKTLTANANGTIRDDIALPAAAALGHYFIEARSGDRSMSGHFEVEEYKKPEYEVRVTPTKVRVLQGEKVQATVEARYYFGEPVAGAKVKYAIYRDRYWFPIWRDEDDETEIGPPEDDDGGDQVGEQEGVLDSDGKLTVTVSTTVSARRYDYRYRVEARVTDAANREITGRGGFIATYGSFALNVAPQRYFYEPGAKASFTVEARSYEMQPVSARVRIDLLKWDYREPERRDVRGTVEVDAGGTGTIDIPREGGSYRLRATARTPEGREVEDFAYLWVAGGGSVYETDMNRGVQIVPDKKSYRAGDTAKLLVITGRPDTPVYVSVEGRDLRWFKLLREASPSVSFEFPIASTDEPGITVSASFVRQGNLYTGMKYVKVPPVSHQLNIAIATDKPQYTPGQPATYRVDVTTPDGKPAPRAEVSLGVVDEAIYAIRRDAVPDPLAFFFDREWNRVMTMSSLQYYFHGEAGKRRMRLAELRPPSRLAQLKPERLAEPKVRKVFPDTAYWAADLVTDDAGRAQAKLEFPDSLTTWRATARGVTTDTKVGSAIQKTIVRKNVIIRLSTPRFFVQGDEIVISAIVHNYLAEAKTARVSLAVEGLDMLEGATRDISLPSRGEGKVDWRVRAQNVRSAKLTGKALTDAESDALELELPVNVPGVKLAESRGGSVAGSVSAVFDLAFPPAVTPGSRSLSIRVSPSVAGSLFSALEYLTSFPYGCVEQTMSSFLPNITVSQAARDLKLKTDLDERALREKVRAGLDRLASFQHEDGGWGWWQTDESHPFMTAYVVAGMVQAKAANFPVEEDRIKRGGDWLVKAVADRKLAGDLRAYMSYALVIAGRAAEAPVSQLFERRVELSPYGLAILGLALQERKNTGATDVASALERAVQQNNEEAWWPATRDQMLDFSDDATPEATAYAVKFLARERPDSPLLPKAALWLMNHRNQGFWWSSTKQTAMVIYGLIDYLKVTNELNSNITATVFVNDRQVLTRKLDADQPALVLDESKLNPGSNRIRVTASGTGRVYYSARAEYWSNADNLQKVGGGELNVGREYFRLVPDRDGERIVYDLAPLGGPVTPGDLIAVKLTVAGSEWRYLMIEDPIPAGTEFVERDNNYALRTRPPWWQWYFTRRELHDDRMALFQTYFPKGRREYFYLLKVVNPGAFQVSPARVAPMYQTGVIATTDSRRLEVK